ncbi:hypothetical protein BCR44DRAFT_1219843 [Catenaria anguillulae PL171]|uniref:Uncharacterized protein n=1 Tax=Catenaria anguillulae PL171 TaxID=765915 RepID=A0A1Y2HZH2_9FUNG|nr:hypothetical protein BCR44DRAFT_1219843 [Catenaria anguillulae PL171]
MLPLDPLSATRSPAMELSDSPTASLHRPVPTPTPKPNATAAPWPEPLPDHARQLHLLFKTSLLALASSDPCDRQSALDQFNLCSKALAQRLVRSVATLEPPEPSSHRAIQQEVGSLRKKKKKEDLTFFMSPSSHFFKSCSDPIHRLPNSAITSITNAKP